MLKMLKMDVVTLEAVSAEVFETCREGAVQRVFDGRATEVLLQIRAPGITSLVLLSAGDRHARIHLKVERTVRQQNPSPFVGLLRKHLVGSRLVGLGVVGGDRVVRVEFLRRSRPEAAPELVEPSENHEGPSMERLSLVAELTGRHGNLFLLDVENRILGSLRSDVSHRRDNRVRNTYSPPELTSAAQVETTAEPNATLLRLLKLAASNDGRLSAYLDAHFESGLTAGAFEQVKRTAAKTLARALKRGRKKVGRIEGDLSRAEGAEALQRFGELLSGAHGRAQRGATSVTVIDYFDSDMPEVEVPLDPVLSVKGNLQRYFKQAKRFKAARAAIVTRLDSAKANLKTLERARASLEAATSIDEVGALWAEWSQRRTMGKPLPSLLDVSGPKSRPARKDPAARLPYREFTSQSGFRILVGKGAKDNDHLSLKIARGRDLWMHADGTQGAHVVVRRNKNQQIDAETLLDAATLAAFYSGLRRDTRVDVHYTEQKYIRKPKGAPAGMVTVAGGKTVTVRMQQPRLDRLFAQRPVDK